MAGWFPPVVSIETDLTEPPQAGDEVTLAIVQIQGNTVPVSGAEFGLEADALEILELTPRPGFENLGTMTSPILISTPDCFMIDFKVVMADVRVRALDSSGGSLCFRNSDDLGVNCSIVCWTGTYVFHQYAGYRWGADTACSNVPDNEICEDPVSVESHSWGRIKAAYGP